MNKLSRVLVLTFICFMLGISFSGCGKVSYTVSFVSKGGSTVASQTVDENGYVSVPTPPTKDKAIFEGWFSDSNTQFPWDFETMQIKGNTTLYAKWEDISVLNITFEDDTIENYGYELESVSGIKTIEHSQNFSFNLKVDISRLNDESLIVTANGEQLEEDNAIVQGQLKIYTFVLSSVTYHQEIEVSGLTKKTFRAIVESPIGYNIEDFEGYNKDSIKHGDEYKFTVVLQEGYKKQNFEVSSNSEPLTANLDGVFTISNVINNNIITVMGVVKKTYTVTINETRNQESDFTIEKDYNQILHGESYHFTVTINEKYDKTQVEDFISVVINSNNVTPTFIKSGNVYNFSISATSVAGNIFISLNSTTWQENIYVVTLPLNPSGYTITASSHTPIEAGGNAFEVNHLATFVAEITLLEGYQHCRDFRVNFAGTSMSKDVILINGVITITGINSDGELSLQNLSPNQFTAEAADETGYEIISISSASIEEDGQYTFEVSLQDSHELIGEDSMIEYQTYLLDNPYTVGDESYTSTFGTVNLVCNSEGVNRFTISHVTGNLKIKLTNIKIKEYNITLPDNGTNVGFTLSSEILPNEYGKYVIPHGQSFTFTATLNSEYSLAIHDIKIDIDGQEFYPSDKDVNNAIATFKIINIKRNMVVSVINALKNEFEVRFNAFVTRNGKLVQGRFINHTESGYIDEFTYSVIVQRNTNATPPLIDNIELPAGYKLSSSAWIGNFQNVNSDLNISANFIPENYKISYVLANGINHPDNINTPDERKNFTIEDVDNGLILKDATRAQYTFAGWFKDADKTIKLIDNKIESIGNITLYASWVLEVGAGKTFENLQDAVNNSNAFDTILIYDGIYNKGANFNHSLKLIAAPNNLAVVFNVEQSNLYQYGSIRYAFGYSNTSVKINVTIENISIIVPITANVHGVYLCNANLFMCGVEVSGGQYAVRTTGNYDSVIIEQCTFNGLLGNGASIWVNTFAQSTIFKAENNEFVSSTSGSTAIKISFFENAKFDAIIKNNNFIKGQGYGENTTAILVEGNQNLEIEGNNFENTDANLGWEKAIILQSPLTKTEFLNTQVVSDYIANIINNTFEGYILYKDIAYADIVISLIEEENHLANIYVNCLDNNNMIYDILRDNIADDIFFINENIILSAKYTMATNKTVELTKFLYIIDNLTISEGCVLTVEGNVYSYGNIENNGTILINGGAIEILDNVVLLGTTHEQNLGINISKLELAQTSVNEFNLTGFAVSTPTNVVIRDYITVVGELYIVAFRVYEGVEFSGQVSSLNLLGTLNYYSENVVDNFGYVSVFVDVEYNNGDIILQQIEMIIASEIITISTNDLQAYSYLSDSVLKETTISYDADINSLYFHLEKNEETQYSANYNVYGMAIEENNDIINGYFNSVHSNHFVSFKYYVGLQYAGWTIQENWAVDVSYEYRKLGGTLNNKKNGLAFLGEDENYYNTVDENGFLNYIIDVCVFNDYRSLLAHEKVNLLSFTATFNLDGNDYELVMNTMRTDTNNMILKMHSLDVYSHWLGIEVRPTNTVVEGINTMKLFASAGNKLEGAIIEVKENAQVKNLDAFKTGEVYDGSNWFLPIRIWAGLENIGKNVNINIIQFVGNENARYHLYNKVLNNGYIEFIVELTEYDNDLSKFNLSSITMSYTINEGVAIDKSIEITSLIKYQDSHISPIMKNNLYLGVNVSNYLIEYDEKNENYYNVTGQNFTGVTTEENPLAFEHYNAVKGNTVDASGYFIAFNAFVGAKNFYEEITVNVVYKDAGGLVIDSLTETRTLFVNAMGFAGILLDGMVQDVEGTKTAGYSTAELEFKIGENVVSAYELNISSVVFI